LNNRHRDTLRQIFRHPISHNIEWRAVLSLLEAIGTVTVRHDGKVDVTIGPEREFLDPPPGKDIDAQMVADLRRMLSSAGDRPAYRPARGGRGPRRGRLSSWFRRAYGRARCASWRPSNRTPPPSAAIPPARRRRCVRPGQPARPR